VFPFPQRIERDSQLRRKMLGVKPLRNADLNNRNQSILGLANTEYK